jgi:PKD repeat protein
VNLLHLKIKPKKTFGGIMKKTFILCIILSILSTVLSAQTPPDTLWTKTYDGDELDCGRWVEQTSDGGYIITGETESFGSGDSDVLLIKTDEMGNSQWIKNIGGNYDDFGYCVQQTNDGGFIIIGAKGGYYSDLFLIKTNALGDTLWTKAFDRAGARDIGFCVRQTNDNGYIITGQVNPVGRWATYIWLIKTDSNGNMLWQKDFGDSGGTCPAGYSVHQTSDNGYIVLGSQYDYVRECYDAWLIKTDANGDSLWSKKFYTNDDDYGKSVQETSDNGYIIAGYTSQTSSGNVFLIKTDGSGNIVWNRTFTKFNRTYCYSVQQTFDGGFFLFGETYSDPSASFLYLLKTDNNGILIWDKLIENSILNYVGNGIQTTQNTYLVTASTNHEYPGDYADAWLIHLESDFKADFNANSTLGYYPSFEVNFSDLSNGYNITNWSWDFQNDGIYDSFIQNPTFTYTDVGVYDVKLKISNETIEDSLIKYGYITVEYVPPAPPTNVQVNIVHPDAIITWTAVDTTIFGTMITPDGYIVLNNDDPYTDFIFLSFTPDTTYTHAYVGQYMDQMFYRVVAVINLSREEIRYLLSLNNSRDKVKWPDVKRNFNVIRK